VKGHPFERGFDLTLRPHKLLEPLSWRSPRRIFVRRIFVNSMSDLFHKEVPTKHPVATGSIAVTSAMEPSSES
jgi:protein gp37